MDQIFTHCDLNRLGWMRDDAERLVVIDMGDNDVVNFTIELVTGAWSGTVIHVHYSNSPTGPWVDYTTNIRLTTADRTSGLVAHVGRYVRCEVTTASGAEARADIYIHARKSQIDTQVLV
jgi:hypothetical protein